MTEDRIEEGDIVEIVNTSGLSNLKRGTRGLVYHVDRVTKIIGVHFLDGSKTDSRRFGYFFAHRFRKIGEDKQFKLLLAIADLEEHEENLHADSNNKLKIAKLYISQFGDRNEKNWQKSNF